MSDNKIYHYSLTRGEYETIEKSEYAIYFVTETDGTISLYKGVQQVSNPIKVVGTFPTIGEAGKFYLNMALGEIRIWTTEWVTVFPYSGSGGSGGSGDMRKAVYDSNNDGVVNAADTVAWGGVTSKPSSFTPSPHSHTYAEISGAPTVGSGALTISKGGASWTFNANATSDTVVDLGGEMIVDSALNSSSTNPVQNKAIYSAVSAKQDKITSTNKLPYSMISGTPTIGSGMLTISSGGSTYTFGANQSSNTTIDLGSGGGGGSVTVDSALDSASTNPVQNKAIYSAVSAKADASSIGSGNLNIVTSGGTVTFNANQSNNSSVTIPTVNNPTITFNQGGVSKGAITLNQTSSATINFDAGGSGGGGSTQTPIVESTDTTLTVSAGGAYKWTPASDGTLSLTGAASGYESLTTIAIVLGASNTVTVSGITLADSLVANATNYCGIYYDGSTAFLYLYYVVLSA